MNIEERLTSFIKLGEKITSGVHEFSGTSDPVIEKAIEGAFTENPWFTRENVVLALDWIRRHLTENKLSEWLAPYMDKLSTPAGSVTVGTVMAGNIPLVGFHDFLSVLLAGHRIRIKLSSKDQVLFRLVTGLLESADPRWNGRIFTTTGKLRDFDAVITTGSNNTSRIFKYYFGKYPHLFRKNRNGIAVLNGTETGYDLELLAGDIFTYFGLGCRNVSKLFLPAGFDLSKFTMAFERYHFLVNHNKYHNNYTYYRSVYLVGSTPFFDTGELLLTQDPAYASPVGVVYYEFYEDLHGLESRILADKDRIQCVVSNSGLEVPVIAPGKTQDPELFEYADGLDTMEFLLNLPGA